MSIFTYSAVNTWFERTFYFEGILQFLFVYVGLKFKLHFFYEVHNKVHLVEVLDLSVVLPDLHQPVEFAQLSKKLSVFPHFYARYLTTNVFRESLIISSVINYLRIFG